ncbi:MAG: hypothetical protein H6815_00970 [Phycisphaeraceae bacterium]|nr:hypothetical protein [Phycisphaerales bacterium]MCB9858997.1 hypothetical protein [Phycisphaeraceae bacterium]
MSEPTQHAGMLPSVRTSLSDSDVVERLSALSRRGKLAGYKQGGRGLFECDAFGQPFDSSLIGSRASENTIGFSLKMKPTLPLIFWVLMVLSIWPGVWLTDSMLRTWFGWYDFNTYLWYLPLTILPLPWIYKKTMPQSRNASIAEAHTIIDRISTTLEGELVTPE